MNKRDVKGAFVIILLVVYTILFRNLIADNFPNMYYAITSAFIAFIAFLSYLFFGYQKFKFNSIRKNVLILVFIVMVVYFILIYGIGFFTGYERSKYDLSFTGIFNNIFGLSLYIIASEIFRYIFISANRDKKYLAVLISIILSLIEFNLTFTTLGEVTVESMFYLITTTVVPVIVKHILLSYLCYNLGHVPAIVYNLIMSIYMFVIPVVPNISNYFISLLGIIIPFIIYIFSSRMLTEYYDKTTPEFNHRVFSFMDIPIGIAIVVLALFISGIFRFFLIGVASESMSPYINKGDAVLIDKSIKIKDMKKGDVIAYQSGDKVIIHRIVTIDTNKDGVIIVDTKGDANNVKDNVELKDEDIIGKMVFKIPYIAWPTVWLKERFG